jgi:hypothetical protein
MKKNFRVQGPGFRREAKSNSDGSGGNMTIPLKLLIEGYSKLFKVIQT